MNRKNFPSDFGDPDISLSGLRIWLHNRRFPDSYDYWDGNWVIASAEVSAVGAVVNTHGPFLHLGDLRAWLDSLNLLRASMVGEANLEPIEAELNIKMVSDALGHIAVAIDITPDTLFQKHRFEFEVDQSYLPSTIRELEAALKKFPLRGKP